MSDSLLNLLEVLNEVLEEQKLQEQASGGAPTLESIKNGIKNNVVAEYLNILLPSILENYLKRRSKKGIPMRNADLFKVLKKILPIEDFSKDVRGNLFSILDSNLIKTEEGEISYDTSKANARNFLSYLDDPQSQDWNYLIYVLQYAVQNKFAPRKIKENSLQQLGKIKDYLINANNSNIKKEGSIKVDNNLIKALKNNVGATVNIFKKGSTGTWLIGTLGRGGDSNRTNDKFMGTVYSFLDNASQGKPWYFGSNMPSGLGSMKDVERASYFADSKFSFDLEDISAFTTQALGGNFKNLPSLILTLRDIETNDQIKQTNTAPIVRNKLIEEFDKIFDEIRDNPQFVVDNSSSIRFAIETFLNYPEWQQYGEKVKRKLSGYIRQATKGRRNDPSVTSPSIKTSTRSLSKGFGKSLKYFFGDATGFAERIDIFNEKMKLFTLPKEEFQNRIKTLEHLPYSIYGGSEEARQEEEQHVDILDLINRVVVMDYFVEFSKGFSAPIAGLMFEYFLAGLVGGEVIGQRGDVVDFQVDGSLGSAKFISSLKSVTQALSSFEVDKVLGKEVTYVVGLKKASEFKLKDDAVAPLEIQEVDIYTFSVIYRGEGIFSIDGGTDENVKDKKREIKNVLLYKEEISFANIVKRKPPETTIKIMSTDTSGVNSYRKTLGALLDGSDDSVTQWYQQTLKKIEEIFDKIKGGESDARDYVQTGEKRSGENAMKQLYDSREGIASLSDTNGRGALVFKARKPKPNDA